MFKTINVVALIILTLEVLQLVVIHMSVWKKGAMHVVGGKNSHARSTFRFVMQMLRYLINVKIKLK